MEDFRQYAIDELEWDGSVLIDQEGALHAKYGVREPSFYLIRPDGDIGFRSQPAANKSLAEYLDRMFITVDKSQMAWPEESSRFSPTDPT